jgi:NAD(P)H-dependent flavin oxidoreductase YrpB (nitropropane dioxygenase family)
MKTPICDMLGIEFPLLAFSHCRDVVAAVSRAGGFGVFGATRYLPETLEQELKWIDDHVDGKPYGIDVLIPENISTAGEKNVTWKSLEKRVSQEHRDFTRNLLKKYNIELTTQSVADNQPQPFDAEIALELLDVSFRHPIKLIANALGVPPKAMVEKGRKHGVPVAALVGSKEHALRQVAAGVDILVAQGTEAGGHCGEVSTMVLVPEVIKAIKPIRTVPVLAAGGIMTGHQMAACMAMGAAGAWTGSVWLATVESETSEIFREKMIAASSRDAIRSKGRTGKPARQLRSVWTDAWDRGPDCPGALPMPLQSIISRDAFNSIDRAAAAGNTQARDLVSYFVGQGVGLIDSVKSAGAVVQEFKEDFIEAVEHMNALMEE